MKVAQLYQFLVSINKMSIVASIGVFAVLVYEILLTRKNKVVEKIKVPDFSEKINSAQKVNLRIKQKKKNISTSNRWVLLFTTILLIFLGFISVVGLFLSVKLSKSEKNKNVSEKVYYLSSKGIFVFDLNWRKLSESELNKYKNKVIIISIEVPKKLLKEVDMARIRVNRDDWSMEDITTNFNKEHSVFYRKYKIPAESESLKIYAQLHSRESGWLGN